MSALWDDSDNMWQFLLRALFSSTLVTLTLLLNFFAWGVAVGIVVTQVLGARSGASELRRAFFYISVTYVPPTL